MKQPWYKPKKNFKETDLTATDRYNINLLESQENKLKENNYYYVGKIKNINFNNVYNSFQYPAFSDYEKEKLCRNGFIVLPTNRDQLFHIYENNDYLGIPSFITADAVLQLYHLYFDTALRNIESKYLLSYLETLIGRLIGELQLLKNTAQNKSVINAIDFNLAYMAVSRDLINGGGTKITGGYKDAAAREIENCRRHEGFQHSPLLDRMMDYSQYIPRGHYTRSEELKRYFLSMMWLGNAGIEAEKNILSGVILTYILYNKTYNNRSLISIWKNIYEPTAFFAGASDDTGPVELKKEMDAAFPSVKNIDQYDNAKKLAKIVKSLPSERISGHGTWGEQKSSFG